MVKQLSIGLLHLKNMKRNINLWTLLERLNKSKCLSKKYFEAHSNYISKNQKQEQKICNLLHFEYNDVLDYASLIFDDVCGQLCEYIKDRKQGSNPKYKKLYDMRNEKWHCDDNVQLTNDFQYVESIINEWISKPLSNEEIDYIKKQQIAFGEKLGIYDPDDNELTKLNKSAKAIKFFYHKKQKLTEL